MVSLVQQLLLKAGDVETNPGPTRIPSSDLSKLLQIGVRSKWREVGLQIGIQKSELDKIQANHQNAPNFTSMCEMHMFDWWLNNGKDVTYEKLAKALHSIELHDAEKSLCRLSGVLPLCRGVNDIVPHYIERYRQYLKTKYLQQPVLPQSSYPPPVGGEYINLALIQKEREAHKNRYDSVVEVQKDCLRGNIDRILKYKTEIKFNGIFEPILCKDCGHIPLKILIDGAPGVGKTTLSRKISREWAQGSVLGDYDLVILLHLRSKHVSRAKSIEDLFYHDDLVLRDEIVQHVRQTSGVKVMFIFDGFDELSYNQRQEESLFLDIMNGTKFNRCSVVITSRPYASGELQKIESLNRHVEILGFTEDQIKESIKKTISDQEKAKELCLLLEERMDILTLCYIPLNCSIMLFVYQMENFKLPKTLTELYELFILNTLRRHTLKNFISSKIKCLDNLPLEISEQFSALCEISFNGLEADKLVFQEEDIDIPNSNCNIESKLLSLMTTASSYTSRGSEITCNFLHLTIQEFLAAVWASKFSSETILTIFKERISNDRFRMMLLFLSGLTKLAFPNASQIYRQFEFSYSGVGKLALVCHLIYESQDSTLYSDLSDCFSWKYLNMTYACESNFDCFVVANFIAHSGCTWDICVLEFEDSDTTEQCLRFIKQFTNCDSIPLINEIQIAAPLSSLSILNDMTYINYASVTINEPDEDMFDIHNTSIKTLNMTVSEVYYEVESVSSDDDNEGQKDSAYYNENHNYQGFCAIGDILKVFESLQTFDMTWYDGVIEDANCLDELVQRITYNNTLEDLKLDNISVSCCRSFFIALSKHKLNLKTLVLSVHVEDSSTESFLDALSVLLKTTSLARIKIHTNHFLSQSEKVLLDAIRSELFNHKYSDSLVELKIYTYFENTIHFKLNEESRTWEDISSIKEVSQPVNTSNNVTSSPSHTLDISAQRSSNSDDAETSSPNKEITSYDSSTQTSMKGQVTSDDSRLIFPSAASDIVSFTSDQKDPLIDVNSTLLVPNDDQCSYHSNPTNGRTLIVNIPLCKLKRRPLYTQATTDKGSPITDLPGSSTQRFLQCGSYHTRRSSNSDSRQQSECSPEARMRHRSRSPHNQCRKVHHLTHTLPPSHLSQHHKVKDSSAAHEHSTPITLQPVFKVLLPLAADWQNIGCLLNIPEGTLRAIKRDNTRSSDCLREMITEWLKQEEPRPTWQALGEAVEQFGPSQAQEIQDRCVTK